MKSNIYLVFLLLTCNSFCFCAEAQEEKATEYRIRNVIANQTINTLKITDHSHYEKSGLPKTIRFHAESMAIACCFFLPNELANKVSLTVTDDKKALITQWDLGGVEFSGYDPVVRLLLHFNMSTKPRKVRAYCVAKLLSFSPVKTTRILSRHVESSIAPSLSLPWAFIHSFHSDNEYRRTAGIVLVWYKYTHSSDNALLNMLIEMLRHDHSIEVKTSVDTIMQLLIEGGVLCE